MAETSSIPSGVAALPSLQKPSEPHRLPTGIIEDCYGCQGAIWRAGAALQGIAAMMRPETSLSDHQMNLATSSEASAVFEFFGEILRAEAEELQGYLEDLHAQAKTEALHG